MRIKRDIVRSLCRSIPCILDPVQLNKGVTNENLPRRDHEGHETNSSLFVWVRQV
jgi:hypothetical protein